MLWDLLAEFVFRLSFGLAVAMAWTPSSHVNSGFYRVHLWVLLGLNTFAALAISSSGLDIPALLPLAIFAAAASYVGSVMWLYEAKLLGTIALYVIGLADFTAALLVLAPGPSAAATSTAVAQVATSGLLLGLTMSAMLLGHWYLNNPGMQLRPLRDLIVLLLIVVGLRSLLCGGGLVAEASQSESLSPGWIGLVALRWLSGLIGISLLAVMTWLTLKIPNTQSATGILYVAVIFSFLGELCSQLLVVDAHFPL